MTDKCEHCRAPVVREGDRVQFDSSRYHMDAAKKLSEISALRWAVEDYQQREDEIIVALGSQGTLPSEIVSKIQSLHAEGRDCICKGNWRAIVKEVGDQIGNRFVDNKGNEYTFFGVVHAEDDYYYGMWRRKDREMVLSSCVGSLESNGYAPVIR